MEKSPEQSDIQCSTVPGGDLVVVRERLTGVEAAAVVTVELCRGRKLSPRMVAAMTGLSPHDACRLLGRMSRVIAIVSSGGGANQWGSFGGGALWYMCDERDGMG